MFELMALALLQDPTVPTAGLIGMLLMALAPVLRTSVTSGLIYLANKATTLIADWSNAAKRIATVVVGVLVSNGLNFFFAVMVPENALEWTTATAIGAGEGIVTTVIYWIGTLGKKKS